jgi:hypothetical protein
MDTVPGLLSQYDTDPTRRMVDDCKCAPGFFRSTPVNTVKSCTVCEVGSYKNSSSDDGCRPCFPGTSTKEAGSNSPFACTCKSGFAGSGAGRTAECRACPLGKFKKTKGTGQCQLCPAGSMAPTNGSITCEICPAGKFSRIMGSSQCASCVLGSYQTEPGATYCSVCGPGKYATSEEPSQSRYICQNCPGGKFSNGTLPTVGNSTFGNSSGKSLLLSW